MNRCKFHGGMTPVGPASPQYKTGRYSKHLPGELLARYQEALRDPDLIAIRDELALMHTRLQQLLSKVDVGETGALWKDMKDLFGEFQRARRRGQEDAMDDVLEQVEHLIERGATDSEAWQEVYKAVETVRKLSESEQKRLVSMQQMITAERAMTLLAAVVSVIHKHVTDKKALAAISTEFAGLVSIGVGGQAVANGDNS